MQHQVLLNLYTFKSLNMQLSAAEPRLGGATTQMDFLRHSTFSCHMCDLQWSTCLHPYFPIFVYSSYNTFRDFFAIRKQIYCFFLTLTTSEGLNNKFSIGLNMIIFHFFLRTYSDLKGHGTASSNLFAVRIEFFKMIETTKNMKSITL